MSQYPGTVKKQQTEILIKSGRKQPHGRNFSGVGGILNMINDEGFKVQQVNEDTYASNIAGSSMIHSLLMSP